MVQGEKRSIEPYFRPSFYIVPVSITYLACRAEAHHSTQPSTCSDLFELIEFSHTSLVLSKTYKIRHGEMYGRSLEDNASALP